MGKGLSLILLELLFNGKNVVGGVPYETPNFEKNISFKSECTSIFCFPFIKNSMEFNIKLVTQRISVKSL